MLQNVLYSSQVEAKAVARTDVDFEYCSDCHFVFNPGFDDATVDYTQEYDNNQMQSPTYARYLDELTSKVVAICGLHSDSRVLEIGCGNGYFLSEIQKKSGARQVRGYDPTYRDQHGMTGRIEQSYFHAQPGEHFDLIMLRHTLEGMLSVDQVFHDIRAAMHEHSILYLEIMNLDYILQQRDVSLLFHECPRYYSVRALQRLLWEYALEVKEVYSLFNDNYLGVLAIKRPAIREVVEAQDKLREIVPDYQRPVIWGVAGRAISTLTNLGWDERVVRFAVDVDSNKQGKYVPVTGQRIVSPEEVLEFDPDLIIVANTNYLAEIQALAGTSRSYLTLDGTLHQQ